MSATAAHILRQERNSCHLHLMTRVVQRRLPLDLADIVQLEERIERMRPTWDQDGLERIRLRVKLDCGLRLRVVYDAQLRCVLTIWVRPKDKPRYYRRME
ncbi:MAG: hypothetical protein RIB45_17750 [Marivibrio sp.]|uniref:hypothetical protein n=1 Tax=Marivibrio sp. TaxID=2039719 RepID=UPI0032EBEFD7